MFNSLFSIIICLCNKITSSWSLQLYNKSWYLVVQGISISLSVSPLLIFRSLLTIILYFHLYSRIILKASIINVCFDLGPLGKGLWIAGSCREVHFLKCQKVKQVQKKKNCDIDVSCQITFWGLGPERLFSVVLNWVWGARCFNTHLSTVSVTCFYEETHLANRSISQKHLLQNQLWTVCSQHSRQLGEWVLRWVSWCELLQQ